MSLALWETPKTSFVATRPNEHICYLLSLQDADTEDEREEQLVLLKQRSTHIPVDTVGEVVIQVEDSLFKVICGCAVDDRLE